MEPVIFVVGAVIALVLARIFKQIYRDHGARWEPLALGIAVIAAVAIVLSRFLE